MVRASDATFTVRLPDGHEVPCRLTGRRIETLARLLNQPAVFFGTAAGEPSGASGVIEVDGFMPERSMPGLPLDPYGQTPEERDDMAGRLRSIMGTWPGIESDEAIDHALRALSY
jgi:hypothetical protein